MARFALLLLTLGLATPAWAFEWDDGRGAFPFRPVTTRQYEAVRDVEGASALHSVSTTHPRSRLILRSTFSGPRTPPPGGHAKKEASHVR
jgi:hypothetical protein